MIKSIRTTYVPCQIFPTLSKGCYLVRRPQKNKEYSQAQMEASARSMTTVWCPIICNVCNFFTLVVASKLYTWYTSISCERKSMSSSCAFKGVASPGPDFVINKKTPYGEMTRMADNSVRLEATKCVSFKQRHSKECSTTKKTTPRVKNVQLTCFKPCSNKVKGNIQFVWGNVIVNCAIEHHLLTHKDFVNAHKDIKRPGKKKSSTNQLSQFQLQNMRTYTKHKHKYVGLICMFVLTCQQKLLCCLTLVCQLCSEV